jgi:hypothetical protein
MEIRVFQVRKKSEIAEYEEMHQKDSQESLWHLGARMGKHHPTPKKKDNEIKFLEIF